jgi:hypothetical protein
MCHDGGQRCFWHEGMKTEAAGIFKRATEKIFATFWIHESFIEFCARLSYIARQFANRP